jgi:hypothetical protein
MLCIWYKNNIAVTKSSINNWDFNKHMNLTQSHQSFCVVHTSFYYKWYQCNRKCNINQCFCNLLQKHITCLNKTKEFLTEWKLQAGCHCNLISQLLINPIFLWLVNFNMSVTVAERSRACTAFAHSEAGIVGLNPTQGMDVWCVYVFILCLYCSVFRQRPCDELITRPRSPTICKNDHETEKQRPRPKWAVEPVKKKKLQHYHLKKLPFDCQQPDQSSLHPLNVFSQNQF